MIGKRFGKQVVLKLSHIKNSCKYFLVICDCENRRIVREFDLIRKDSKRTLSCRKCCNIKHGYSKRKSRHYLYRIWYHFKSRCLDIKNKDYKYYGARGITFTSEWNEFIPFKDYIINNLGERPSKHSLDRINNDKNYEPNNLRWATQKEQIRNSRICLGKEVKC